MCDNGFNRACPTGNHWTDCRGAGAPDRIEPEEEDEDNEEEEDDV